MATTTAPKTVLPTDWTLADLQEHLGGIPLERIRLYPPPGMATVQHVNDLNDHKDRLCELIDGVLVEKTMGWYESRLAIIIAHLLQSFLDVQDLGVVSGEAGALQILEDQVRIPDVCFVGWDHFPDRKLPRDPIPNLAPDLAIEVLSASNTKKEMDRKLREYFAAGVSRVWYVDADARTARAYTGPEHCETVGPDGVLDGGDVLPGFKLSLSELFARAGERT